MTTDDLTSRGWRVAAFSHSNGCSCAQTHWLHSLPFTAAAAAKSLQLCPTLCDPIDGSPPGSPIPGILQARTLEQVAISFSNAWKWKVKVKSLSRVQLFATQWTAAYQAPPSMGFSRQQFTTLGETVSSLCTNSMFCQSLFVACEKWKSLSRVQLFVIPWIIQSMEFSRPEYWSG